MLRGVLKLREPLRLLSVVILSAVKSLPCKVDLESNILLRFRFFREVKQG